MERQTFRITIDAPRERVWDVLWDDATYREWTAVFSEGSNAETDWNEGSRVLFLDPEGDGIVSTIAVKRAPEFMSFKHLGEVYKHVENDNDDRENSWKGAMENYILRDIAGTTELTVETDITDDFRDYFAEAWPKALEKIRSIVDRKKTEVTI